MSAPYVSVVVPTCGRADLLARCLEALEHQTLARSHYEIIVADDSELRSGPAAARNRGWRKARAPIVAFTDDDTVPAPDWLERGLEAMKEHIDAASGRIVMPIPAAPTDYERDAQGLEHSEFVTANCFVRRRVLECLGGFDEGFRMAWREDSDLHFSLLKTGARLVHAPRAVVVHPVRPAGWAVSMKQQRKVMYDALLFKKHRALYRARIRAGARWDYYVIVASLAAALAGSMPAALLWALLTGRFFLQRMRGTSKRPAHVAEMLVTSALIPPLAVFWRLAGALRYRVAFL
ncbi:MAG: glycosyltransferase family 2 protein [Burkholderiales bacterium]